MANLLVTAQRAILNPTLATLASTNPAALASLIAAGSEAAQQYCHRIFGSATYTEYRDGGIYIREALNLRQYPVTNLAEVATANRALQVGNNGTTAQKATVQTMSNGDIKLISVASAVVTTTTLAAATYTTIGAMSTAINAISGWNSTVFSGAAGSYTNFPTTDLKTMQGAASAMVGGAYLDIYEPWYGWNNAAWFPDDGYDVGAVTSFWRLDVESGQVYGHLPRGQLNMRFTYTAGYAAIPEDIQEAVVQLCQFLYQQGQTNSALTSARLGDAAVVFNNAPKWPAVCRLTLDRYSSYDKLIAR